LLRTSPQLRAQRTALDRQLSQGEAELNGLEARAQELRRSIEAISRQRDCVRAGDMGDPRAHIRRSLEPEPAEAARQGRLAETWAALSIGLLLLTAVAMIRFGSTDTVAALVILVGGAVLVDNILRGTVRPLLLNASIVLAVVTADLVWSSLADGPQNARRRPHPRPQTFAAFGGVERRPPSSSLLDGR
jgi:hypothetical protein